MTHLKLKFMILENYRYQADFAEVTGAAESKISRILNSRQMLTPEESKVWQKHLNCDPSLLEPVTQSG